MLLFAFQQNKNIDPNVPIFGETSSAKRYGA